MHDNRLRRIRACACSALSLAVLSFVATKSANAGILGDTVQIQYLYPDSATPYGWSSTGVVTAGGLTLDLFSLVDVTVFSDNVQMTGVSDPAATFLSATFNGVSVTDLTNPSAFSGFSVDAATTIAAFDISDVSLSGGALFINYQGLVTPYGSLAQVDFTTGQQTPEPATGMLLGLVALAYGSRRYLKSRS